MKNKRSLLIIVLLLVIGFASVSTTLVINGNIGIKLKSEDFNVIFVSAEINGNNEAKATISEDKKSITFETDKLSIVGDKAELIYKVKNNSTQYDANVKVSCTGGNEEYLSIQGEFAGKTLPLTNPELMGAQEVRMGTLSAELIKAYVGEDTKVPITCKLEVEGEGRDSIVEESTCGYADGTEWTFDYTGSEQEFKVPCSGEYKLETWGAQGGSGTSTYIGGYGGYSSGETFFLVKDNLFINVGGEGASNKVAASPTDAKGGYNGGGTATANPSWNHVYGAGGGATHISLVSGILSTLNNNIDDILIVSGGGGGGRWQSNYTEGSYGYGGHGGGFKGTYGTSKENLYAVGGGTQNGTLSGGTSGTFGLGAKSKANGAGGGGFYGGNSGVTGGGGSGYIGNPLLTNKVMYCYNCTTSNEVSTKTISTTCKSSNPTSNCAKQGNGYAKITLVSAKYPKEEYKETLLNGTDPVIKEGLIPVTLENDGTVKKADITSEWYKYEDKKWANAIILEDETVNYNDGDVIPESNIESYFVWVPRYKYQIFNEGNYTSLSTIDTTKVQTIDVVFENKDTEPSIGSKVGEYLTQPAFTAFDVNGLWVGKFETGYKGATSTSTAQVNSSDYTKVEIKPNVYSWRNITVGNAFKASYDYKRNLESHMMKNTEWGAVAYLQHSAYGSATSVRVNNNKAYITGYAGTEEPTKGWNNATSIEGNRVESTSLNTDGTYTINYLNSNSVVASTTSNITGVYDMSGGAYEYVMGYTTKSSTTGGSSGITKLYSDFFTNDVWNKYYDKYLSTANTNYNKRILGDATGEMGPFQSTSDPDRNSRNKSSWYYDYAFFVNSANSWFTRGAMWDSGIVSGTFAFSYNTGGAGSDNSFRLVLAP